MVSHILIFMCWHIFVVSVFTIQWIMDLSCYRGNLLLYCWAELGLKVGPQLDSSPSNDIWHASHSTAPVGMDMYTKCAVSRKSIMRRSLHNFCTTLCYSVSHCILIPPILQFKTENLYNYNPPRPHPPMLKLNIDPLLSHILAHAGRALVFQFVYIMSLLYSS